MLLFNTMHFISGESGLREKKKGTRSGSGAILFRFFLREVAGTIPADFVPLSSLPIPSHPSGRTQLQAAITAEPSGAHTLQHRCREQPRERSSGGEPSLS